MMMNSLTAVIRLKTPPLGVENYSTQYEVEEFFVPDG